MTIGMDFVSKPVDVSEDASISKKINFIMFYFFLQKIFKFEIQLDR